MNNVQKQKRANKSLPFFVKDEFKVSFIIIFVSTILLISTFTFDIVPPILNRGIQPATFPKALLVIIISLTLVVFYLSITLIIFFIVFSPISKIKSLSLI